MAETRKDTEQKIAQLQMLERSLQNLLVQKQQFQIQSAEIDSATKELETSEEAYKIVGSIMVKGNRDILSKELKEKKEILDMRIVSIEKQEKDIRSKAMALQKEVMKELQMG